EGTPCHRAGQSWRTLAHGPAAGNGTCFTEAASVSSRARRGPGESRPAPARPVTSSPGRAAVSARLADQAVALAGAVGRGDGVRLCALPRGFGLTPCRLRPGPGDFPGAPC